MNNNSTLFSLSKWTITLFTVLMVVTAALAGNGIFKSGSMAWLVTGHMHLGNLLFVLAVVQLVVCYVLYTRKVLGNAAFITSGAVFIFTFAQIGLGYSTRSHMVDLVGWHIALGVGLTAATSILSTILWMGPGKNATPNSAQ